MSIEKAIMPLIGSSSISCIVSEEKAIIQDNWAIIHQWDADETTCIE